jgi:hypothetical protein
MAEMDVFERQVAETLLGYADEVSPSVDAGAVVRRVVGPQREPRLGRLSWPLGSFPRRAWILLLLAILLAAMVGGMLVAGSRPAVVLTVEQPTPTSSLPTAVTVPPVGAWSSILSDIRAGTPPPSVATCPVGSDPGLPGPAAQERPNPRWTGNLVATFDRRAGRVVFVDALADTWTFDVCTNRWERMNPRGAPVDVRTPFDDNGNANSPLRELVYDVDSDRTVALGWEVLSVYDANSNTWTRREPVGGVLSPVDGAVYDPASGLILVTISPREDGRDAIRRELWAYDVDADTWTRVGELGDAAAGLAGFLFGYSPQLDRLILGSYGWGGQPSVLVDPRTGAATILVEPQPSLVGGFGSAVYGRDADTAYVYEEGERGLDAANVSSGGKICRFDPDTTTWSPCWETDLPEYDAFGAIVGDLLNDRVLLVHGIWGDWWREADDGVWAIDLETGTRTVLLPPSAGGSR